MEERLHKLIARAGVTSRRHAEQLILAGQVTVNGAVITRLGSKADPERDSIKVAGKLVRLPEAKTYLVLNKPARCVATMSDPEGRKTLREFLAGVRGRVYPAGRLDYQAEGLLLLTSDGELANLVLRAGGLRQTCWIKVKGALGGDDLQRLARRTGVRLRLLKRGPNPWFEAVLSGAGRDVLRPVLARMGHPVEKMKRIRLANLDLGSLAPGEYRHLTPDEVAGLRRELGRTRRGRSIRNEQERRAG